MHTFTSYIRTFLLVSGLFVGLLPACTPPPQMNTRLAAVDVDSSFIDDGREFVTLQKEGIVLSAAFDRSDDRYTIFNVEITNQSDVPVLIDPARFYYQMEDTLTQVPYTDEWAVSQAYALVPDQEIARLENEMQREEAKLKRKKAIWTAVAVVATVAMVAAVADNNSKPVRNRESGFRRANTNRAIVNTWALAVNMSADAKRASVGSYYSKTNNLASQIETWEHYPLRVQTLQPGQRLYGDVVFRSNALSQGNLRFWFPVENRPFLIHFHQTKRAR